LSGNSIGDSGLREILQALANAPTVKTLDLTGNNISDDGMLLLATFTKEQGLKHLTLSNNFISPRGAKVIEDILFSSSSSLTYLNLYDNFIMDVGVSEISNALFNNDSLTFLGLSMNSITDEGIRDLALALQNNEVLQKLHLHNNKIGTDGASALVNALMLRKTPLFSINVSRNNFSGFLKKFQELEEKDKVEMFDIGYQNDESFKEVHDLRFKLSKLANEKFDKARARPKQIVPQKNPSFLSQPPPEFQMVADVLGSTEKLRDQLLAELSRLKAAFSNLNQSDVVKVDEQCVELVAELQRKNDEWAQIQKTGANLDLQLSVANENLVELMNLTRKANVILCQLYALHKQLSNDVKDQALVQVLEGHLH